MRPITKDEGLLMTLEEFADAVTSGSFIDYDGFGTYATASHVGSRSSDHVKPSGFFRDSEDRPEWATHVLWYNR